MILLSLVVVIYVASGGLRAVAYVDTMQCLLLAGGIIALGIISLIYIGGLENLIVNKSKNKIRRLINYFLRQKGHHR